jgi:hypothetical protein
LKDFLDLLYVGILGKPAASDKIVEEITNACLDDVSGEELPEIKVAPEDVPKTSVHTETPVEAPVASQAPAPAVATSKPTTQPKKPLATAKKPPISSMKPPTTEPKKANIPSKTPTSAYSDKENSGLARFSRLISTKAGNNENSEAK